MEFNGILCIYDYFDNDTSGENKAKIDEYCKHLLNFSSRCGPVFIGQLIDKYSAEYKKLTESRQKSIRNWKNGKNVPNRDKLIELCFELGINEIDEINGLMYAFNYEALHLRNIRELCYYFALTNDISYDEAKELAKKEQNKFKNKFGKYSGESKRTETGLYTRIVMDEVQSMDTCETLENYIEDNLSRLGDIKVTAYRKLKTFLTDLPDEEKGSPFLSNDELVRKIYDSMGIATQGGITKYRWESAMKKTEAVSRGILIMYALSECMKVYSRGRNKVDTAAFISDIDKVLKDCTFAEFDPERCLWDKIVYDCIDAAFDTGGLYEDTGVTPYDLLGWFMDYIQDEPEKLRVQ